MARVTPLLDEEELMQWILRRLGAPLLTVELTEDHLRDAVEDARRWFTAKKGVKTFFKLSVQAGESEYTLPDEIDVVYDVTYMANNMDLSLVFSPFAMMDDKVPYDVFAAAGASGGLYSSFTQTLQYIEMAKRIMGAEPDWTQNGRTLHLFPTPRNASTALLEAKSNVVVLDQLGERDADLIKRYALARAKLDLGRIRSKYQEGFPTAQGNATLDGPALLEEGRAEIEALDEEIGLSGFPMLFLVG